MLTNLPVSLNKTAMKPQAGPSVAKLIRKFESMSTTTAARFFRSGPSVSKLIKKYEDLSCTAAARPLRGKSYAGGEGKKALEVGEKEKPVASPLQSRYI